MARLFVAVLVVIVAVAHGFSARLTRPSSMKVKKCVAIVRTEGVGTPRFPVLLDLESFLACM